MCDCIQDRRMYSVLRLIKQSLFEQSQMPCPFYVVVLNIVEKFMLCVTRLLWMCKYVYTKSCANTKIEEYMCPIANID